MGGPVVAEAARQLLKKADEIAQETAEQIEGARVFVSLTHRDHLYSFGLSGELPAREAERIHNKGDTVCAYTMQMNDVVELSDTRVVPELRNRASVADGKILAYLGFPLRDGADRSIGAICATSSQTREWSDLDKAHLKLARKEIEHLVATTLLQYEMQALSEAYTESDRVLMALAGSARMMASVHSQTGEVLFATRALLEEFDTVHLQNAVAQHRDTPKMGGFADGAALFRGPSDGKERRVKLQSEDRVIWGSVVEDAPGGVLFVSWRRGIAQRN